MSHTVCRIRIVYGHGDVIGSIRGGTRGDGMDVGLVAGEGVRGEGEGLIGKEASGMGHRSTHRT